MSASTTCVSHAPALADAGVGGPISPALEAHLAGCARCRGELAERRGLSLAIDDELRATLAVEPSPALLARARARMEEGGAGRGRFAPRWLGWAAAACLLALLALLASRPGGPPRPAVGPTIARSLPPTAAAGQPSGLGAAPAPRAAATVEPGAGPHRTVPPTSSAGTAVREVAARVTAAGAGARGGDALPRVILPPDEERLLLLFVAGLERLRAEQGSLLDGVANAPPLEDLNLGSIAVEPLTITPLGRTE